MGFFSILMMILAPVFEAVLLLRAARGRFLSQFPLFYSYLTYVLCWYIVSIYIYYLIPIYYPSVYWFCYTVMLVAEFAVILEVSDHVFEPFPAIRRLGRLLTACICLGFLSISVVPSMMRSRPSSIAFLDLTMTASLAKSVLIVVLLGAIRFYRIPLGKHASGLMLGFATYLSLFTANTALAQNYGRAVYGKTLSLAGPLSFLLALTIWNIALWDYETVSARGREPYRDAEHPAEPLAAEVGRYHTVLARLLGR